MIENGDVDPYYVKLVSVLKKLDGKIHSAESNLDEPYISDVMREKMNSYIEGLQQAKWLLLEGEKQPEPEKEPDL